MVQLLQGIIDAIRFPSFSYFVNNDNVDPNLVRYFRTEYGPRWQEALNEHLYNRNKNQKRLKKRISQPPLRRFFELSAYDSTP